MKKIIVLMLAMAMGFTFTACGSEPQASKPEESVSAKSSEASTPENAEYVLRVGAATAGKHPSNVWMEAFETELEEKSGGRIDVQLYPAGQLGNLSELIQGLQDGTVDSAVFPTAYFGTTFSGATTLDLPYLFEDSEQAYQILMENDTLYTKAFKEHGVIPVTYLRMFNRSFLLKDPINAMADFEKKKIWTLPSPIMQEEVQTLGATVSNLDVGELAPSLQNGTVDGAFTDLSLFMAQSLHSYAPYMLDMPSDVLVNIYAISPLWWDNIPEDLQAIVEEVADDVSKNVEAPYIDEMRENALKAMQEEGLQVVEASPELETQLREKLEPLTEKFLQDYPECQDIYDELKKLSEADN